MRSSSACRRVGSVVLATMAVTVSACANDGPGAAVDPTSVATFPLSPAGLDGLPLLADATALQSPTSVDGSITVSYRTDDQSPRDVLTFYEEVLAGRGWTPADPVVETSAEVWRGDWLREGRRLQVVASPLALGTGGEAATQFNLVLLDERTDITVADPPPAGDA